MAILTNPKTYIMNYPNRVLKKGETDKGIVEAIQAKLNEKSCGPIEVDGDYGNNTVSAVKLFQTRHTDSTGASLVTDGQIGSVTWAALFGTTAIINNNAAPSSLLTHALMGAISQINVMEDPKLGANRGKEVDLYLRSVGLNPVGQHYSWCAAFVYYAFEQAAVSLAIKNPLVKTAGVLNHWARARCTKITRNDAINDPSKIIPGSIFIIDHGNNLGHTGIVESVNGGNLTTVEGNTNPGLSREGYGVFRLTRRKLGDITKGFLIY